MYHIIIVNFQWRRIIKNIIMQEALYFWVYISNIEYTFK